MVIAGESKPIEFPDSIEAKTVDSLVLLEVISKAKSKLDRHFCTPMEALRLSDQLREAAEKANEELRKQLYRARALAEDTAHLESLVRAAEET